MRDFHQQDAARPVQMQAQGNQAFAPPAFQLHAGNAAPIQRLVQPGGEGDAVFSAFGNAHRRRFFNPDVVGEHEHARDEDDGQHGGIHVNADDRRPEDAPLHNASRVSLHKFHSLKLYIEQNHADLMAGRGIDLRQDLLDFSSAIKEASKTYKKQVKDLNSPSNMDVIQAHYNQTLDQLRQRIDQRTIEIHGIVEREGDDDANMDQIHEQGTDIWRNQWHNTIMAVNRVLVEKWPQWQRTLADWTRQKLEAGFNYMNPDLIRGLDYIGSLAKGYKGPPKQAIRFQGEKFDVDANLDAPPLAAYAMMENNAVVDRGRIWSEDAGIEPITAMEQDIQAALEQAGLIQMGMDPDEPFETVINAENIDMVGADNGADDAIRDVQRAAYAQKVMDLVNEQRSNNLVAFNAISERLRAGGFTEANEAAQHFFKDIDRNEGTYAYSPEELAQIVRIISDAGVNVDGLGVAPA